MKKHIISVKLLLITVVLGSSLLTACDSSTKQTAENEQKDSTATAMLTGDPDNGGIKLPNEFQALVVADTIASPGDAKYRPIGLAQGPDGSLYIADSKKGHIWRVIYNNKVALQQKTASPALARKD